MSVHVSAKSADEASRLPATAWLILGIVLVAEIMDLLDSTITTIAAPTISSSLHGGPGAPRPCRQERQAGPSGASAGSNRRRTGQAKPGNPAGRYLAVMPVVVFALDDTASPYG